MLKYALAAVFWMDSAALEDKVENPFPSSLVEEFMEHVNPSRMRTVQVKRFGFDLPVFQSGSRALPKAHER
jgi:hypothetical protein